MEDYIQKRNDAIKLVLDDIDHRVLNEGPYQGNERAVKRVNELTLLGQLLHNIYGV